MTAECAPDYSHSGAPSRAGVPFHIRCREWIEWASDFVNPILIKEARQAAKSRTFIWPFGLTLLAALTWSYWCSATLVSGDSPQSPGLYALTGFLCILLVPALILVPYMAYQAIGIERQQMTLDLVWITALSGRNIVWGKFLGAMLQLVAYTSALAPCLTFTYFLRGVDIVTILTLLYHTLLLAVLLTSFSIMIATAFRQAMFSMFTSAVVLIVLVIVFFTLSFVISMLTFSPIGSFDSEYYWPFTLAITTLSISFAGLFLLAAGARMSFAGDNQSTLLRSYMLGQQVLFVFWTAYYMLTARDAELYPLLILLGLYWATMGSFMIGELAMLSPRARRTLPQSALGRVFLTWLQPGSGTGYVFTVANAGGVMAFLIGLNVYLQGALKDATCSVALAVWCCIAGFLGMSRLIVLWINRLRPYGAILGFSVTGIIAAASRIIPAIAAELSGAPDDSIFMLVNWVHVIAEAIESNGMRIRFDLLVVVGPLAVSMLLVNLALTVREIAASRLPRRRVPD